VSDGETNRQLERALGITHQIRALVMPRGCQSDMGSMVLPLCYHLGMSKQIAVRLPDDLVEFVDEIVGSGAGRSRAAVVTRALDRERRRVVAARDAEILARTGPDPELAGLAEHTVGLPSEPL